jgi:hypothetical protein
LIVLKIYFFLKRVTGFGPTFLVTIFLEIANPQLAQQHFSVSSPRPYSSFLFVVPEVKTGHLDQRVAAGGDAVRHEPHRSRSP